MINPLQDEHDDNTPSITNTRSLCYCENGGMFKKQIEIATSDTLPVFIWVATDGYYNSFPDTMKPEEIFLRVIPPIFAYIVERGLDALQEILPSILSDISAQGVSGDDISLGIICNIPAMMTTSLKVYELTPQSRDTGSETGCK